MSILAAGPVGLAQEPAAETAGGAWGAVAVGPDGALGWATDLASEESAQERAMAACEGNCTRGFSFEGGCGAIAVSGDQAFAGGGPSREQAERDALGYCESDFRLECAIQISACNDDRN